MGTDAPGAGVRPEATGQGALAAHDARVSTFIADDEPLARAGLQRLLETQPWLRCVGQAAQGLAALEAIEALRPELVFLDIRMPGLSGLELLLRLRHRPHVIFTTAYAEHAVSAFELGALDYLVKPFGAERLQAALERARARLGEPVPPAAERLAEAFAQGPVSRLFVRQGRSILPLAVADLAWCEAQGDYVQLHPAAGGAAPLVHLSLERLAARLDARRFLRIHRAHLVNLDHVLAFRRVEAQGLKAQMRDGAQLPVSRSVAAQLRDLAR